jgi:O-antigen ligase
MTVALLALVFAATLAVSYPGDWPVFALCAGVYLLGALWLIRRPIARGSPLLLPLGAAALWGPLQLFAGITVDRYQTLRASLLWGAYFAIFLVALQLYDQRRRIRSAVLIFAFALSVVSAAQMYTSHGRIFWIFPTPYQDLVCGPFVNRDHFAAFIVLTLPLAIVAALRAPRYALVAGVMIASALAGGSRAGAVLILLETVVLLAPALWGRLRTHAFQVAGCAVAFTFLTGWQLLWDRFREPNPLEFRTEMLASAVAMARERPWTGFGLGAFETAYPGYALFDAGLTVNHAHNDWAEWAAEGGALFPALLLPIALWAAWRSLRAPWLLGVPALFLHSLVDFPLQKPALAALAFLLLALAPPRATIKEPRREGD